LRRFTRMIKLAIMNMIIRRSSTKGVGNEQRRTIDQELRVGRRRRSGWGRTRRKRMQVWQMGRQIFRLIDVCRVRPGMSGLKGRIKRRMMIVGLNGRLIFESVWFSRAHRPRWSMSMIIKKSRSRRLTIL
jgi:hypothetical protein